VVNEYVNRMSFYHRKLVYDNDGSKNGKLFSTTYQHKTGHSVP